MAKRVLAIGLGGSGKASLTILKEQLEQMYGQVPDNVVLLSFDTDSLRDVDRFAGTRLNLATDDRNRIPEFQLVVTPGGMTMDTVLADIRAGRTASFMHWLEHEKLERVLGPAERDIRGGALQSRPISRAALFLRYANPVYRSIIEAIARMYGESESEEPLTLHAKDIEKDKRLIFIIGSVAGGTGSGMLIDVANLVRHAINNNPHWQSISVSAVIVLPDAFASFMNFTNDPTHLKSNSFAALRELDRFMRVHSSTLPYMIRYAEAEQSITWSTNQPFDHVYLVDTACRSATQDFDLSGDPMKGVFPAISDFVLSHIDHSLGDTLAALRSNAGIHYDKGFGRMYSSFNVMSYIFPVDDIIESFAYRFLRELLAYEFLPIPDPKMDEALKQEALSEVERNFTTSAVAGKTNPNIIQKAIVATRDFNFGTSDMSWPGLFRLISLSDSGFAEDYQMLQQSLEYLRGNLVLTRDGDYRREDFADGATRLLNFTEQFLDDYLGPQLDPDDPDSRFGGDWDKILGKYRDALRIRLAEVLDAALLDVLNRRNDQRMLLPNRLPYARAMVIHLKGYLARFRLLLERLRLEQQIETRLRQVGESVCTAMADMNNTRFDRYLPLFMTKPRQAQESFKSQFVERIELMLHQRIYRTVLDVLDSLGAAEKDSSGQYSVLDFVGVKLENWERTLKDVDRILIERTRQHEANRNEKRTVKVRRYLTNPQFEDELYRRPEHVSVAAARIMGQIGDQKGLRWERLDEQAPLDYRLVTTWGERAKGAEEIADTWFVGAKDIFQVLRTSTTIAERLATEFRGHSEFSNRCRLVEEPFLRYNPSKNGAVMFPERYVSFNLEKARDDSARQFLENSRATLRDQGFNVDVTAENVMVCRVVEVSRGAALHAVELYTQCEPEYREKLNRGRESIHLFPEEQNATDFEQSIPTLNETDNPIRVLAPELVVALGNRDKLRAFTIAAAYGVIFEGELVDPETGDESTELWLRLSGGHRLCLSQSKVVRELDRDFMNLATSEREARLYLNALQNYMLKFTELPGFNMNLIERVKGELGKRGVPLTGIESPFTLKLADINRAILEITMALGPSVTDTPAQAYQGEQYAQLRLELVEQFLHQKVYAFKRSPNIAVRDMGTVMHLILREEMGRLASHAISSSSMVLSAWDKVFASLTSKQLVQGAQT